MNKHICRSCLQLKSLKYFYPSKLKKHDYICNQCIYITTKSYRKQYNKKYYQAHRSELNEYHHKYYLSNKKYLIAQSRKYFQTEKGKEIQREITQRRKQKYPEKFYCKSMLENTLRLGNISNSDFTCAICGKGSIDKHHPDYKVWNCFIPLCRTHHSMIHSLEGSKI